MIRQAIEFRCGSCYMTLNIPEAMLQMPISDLRKFFRYMDIDRWRNEEAFKQFFSAIPDVLEGLKAQWEDASRTFQKEYRDPRFDSHGNYRSDKVERAKVKAANDKLYAAVKEAKRKYTAFEKKKARLEELKKLYGG